MGMLLAVSTLPLARPIATHSHATASAASARMPAAASHSMGPVVGRNPMSSCDPHHDGECQHRLDDAADDVAR